MGLIGSPKTLVLNQSTLHNIPEDDRIHKSYFRLVHNCKLYSPVQSVECNCGESAPVVFLTGAAGSFVPFCCMSILEPTDIM